ncbi:hypothetical protein Adt_21011 [Abeliophyllum distichum]|uniref:Uncharacterized protein n=1 Tax=Abeliophyllum distichum TaxID=126358 RepID=A0ABD1SY46_9LAMI
MEFFLIVNKADLESLRQTFRVPNDIHFHSAEALQDGLVFLRKAAVALHIQSFNVGMRSFGRGLLRNLIRTRRLKRLARRLHVKRLKALCLELAKNSLRPSLLRLVRGGKLVGEGAKEKGKRPYMRVMRGAVDVDDMVTGVSKSPIEDPISYCHRGRLCLVTLC